MININLSESIILVLCTKLSEINRCMAQCTKFELSLLNLRFVHFVFTSLASVIVSSYNRFAADHTCRKIAAAFSATCVILADSSFTVSSGTFYFLPRGLFWWMLCKDAYCHIHVLFSFLSGSHSF